MALLPVHPGGGIQGAFPPWRLLVVINDNNNNKHTCCIFHPPLHRPWASVHAARLPLWQLGGI